MYSCTLSLTSALDGVSAHIKGGVASWLEALDTDVFYTGIPALVPRQVSIIITT
jgi:hypothetical protein